MNVVQMLSRDVVDLNDIMAVFCKQIPTNDWSLN